MEITIFYVPELEAWAGLVSHASGYYKAKFYTFEPSPRIVIEHLVTKEDLRPTEPAS